MTDEKTKFRVYEDANGETYINQKDLLIFLYAAMTEMTAHDVGSSSRVKEHLNLSYEYVGNCMKYVINVINGLTCDE